MKYVFLLLSLVVIMFNTGLANDSEFFSSGNQIFPINNSNVVLKKEILNIKYLGGDKFSVNVFYELENPDAERNTIIGFEASLAQYETFESSVTEHPYIKDFIVSLNNEILQYKTGITNKESYYKNGNFNFENIDQENVDYVTENYYDYIHLYYFDCKLKRGTNIITHSYTFSSATSVIAAYFMQYILKTALRWSGNKIGDFTLNLDMGKYHSLVIDTLAFKNFKDVVFLGPHRILNHPRDENKVEVVLYSGQLFYNQKNYVPDNDIFILSNLMDYYCIDDMPRSKFNSSFKIYYNFNSVVMYDSAANQESFKILKNYPFARRGYVFKNKDIQSYYDKMDWYIPNPNYKADMNTLTEEEKNWLKNLKVSQSIE